MQEAKATIECINTFRVDAIHVEAEEECKDWNHCQWRGCALEVFTDNRVHPIVFAEALQDLVINGGSKIRNIYVAGPANCSKTFPHCKIYSKSSVTHAITDKPGWVLKRLNSFSLMISGEAQKLPHKKSFCYLLRDKLLIYHLLKTIMPEILPLIMIHVLF